MKYTFVRMSQVFSAVTRPQRSVKERTAVGAHASSPIILIDVMDTVVRDPFFKVMPAFFKMTFEELLESKHPTAWIEFELGNITEEQFLAKFFKDGRDFDHESFTTAVVDAYEYVDGMENLLEALSNAGHKVHACSNYPRWHEYIESKLQLSQYLRWTYLSCTGPMKGLRKPDHASFAAVIAHTGRPAEDIIFIDDRLVNVVAARNAGMQALQFFSALQLEQELRDLGLLR